MSRVFIRHPYYSSLPIRPIYDISIYAEQALVRLITQHWFTFRGDYKHSVGQTRQDCL